MASTQTQDDRLITTEEAASMLGLSKTTLETWRCINRSNLPFVRLGKAVRYRVGDVREYIRTNTVSRTA